LSEQPSLIPLKENALCCAAGSSQKENPHLQCKLLPKRKNTALCCAAGSSQKENPHLQCKLLTLKRKKHRPLLRGRFLTKRKPSSAM